MSTLPNGNGVQPLMSLPDLDDSIERITALIPEAESALAQIEQARESLAETYHARLRELTERKAQVLSYLKAFAPEAVPKRPPGRPTGIGRPAKPKRAVSDHVLLALIKGIERCEDELFTARGIHQQINASWDTSYTDMGFQQLRTLEFIGKVRKQPGHGGRVLYRILDVQVGERLKATLTERQGQDRQERPPERLQDDERRERVLSIVQDIQTRAGNATAKEVSEVLGYSHPPRKLLRDMCSEGLLEKAEERREGNAPRPSTTYRVKEAVNA